MWSFPGSYGNRGSGTQLASSDVVHRGNPNPNPFLYQTRAQRQRVAAEKEKQGHRSMWRCLCRHMTSWPCFDVVPVVGLPACGRAGARL